MNALDEPGEYMSFLAELPVEDVSTLPKDGTWIDLITNFGIIKNCHYSDSIDWWVHLEELGLMGNIPVPRRCEIIGWLPIEEEPPKEPFDIKKHLKETEEYIKEYNRNISELEEFFGV
jgi:hypothetical protein